MDESQLAKETANADGRRGDSYYQSVVVRVWLQVTLLTLEDGCLCLEDEVKGMMKSTFFQLFISVQINQELRDSRRTHKFRFHSSGFWKVCATKMLVMTQSRQVFLISCLRGKTTHQIFVFFFDIFKPLAE